MSNKKYNILKFMYIPLFVFIFTLISIMIMPEIIAKINHKRDSITFTKYIDSNIISSNSISSSSNLSDYWKNLIQEKKITSYNDKLSRIYSGEIYDKKLISYWENVINNKSNKITYMPKGVSSEIILIRRDSKYQYYEVYMDDEYVYIHTGKNLEYEYTDDGSFITSKNSSPDEFIQMNITDYNQLNRK